METSIDTSAHPPEDPWLTVGEFADATRVKPVTVRSWIAKGQLKATRSGKRKWLIRTSELDRMLGDQWLHEASDERLESMYAEHLAQQRAEEDGDFHRAGYEWDLALERSSMAPPDAQFSNRLRHIARAAAWWGSALGSRTSIDPDFRWKPVAGSAGMTLSYELRPGGTRPGPRDAWERFDRTVARLGTAMEGELLSAVTTALQDLAAAATDICDTLDAGD